GVEFIDDSKATNPHAARSSILAHPQVVWVGLGGGGPGVLWGLWCRAPTRPVRLQVFTGGPTEQRWSSAGGRGWGPGTAR
ncbi:hypothetical protein, partial [Nocardia cyriacigeorgica]|uniref:hypothetical protein n=1 Tax=Nocardia cyriacigeorgica TaxID=135487 RepID=UPI00245512A5